MIGTKKRRFKLFSRKRKNKEQRLQQQIQLYKNELQNRQKDRYHVKPGDYKSGGTDYFKQGLTIRPLILEGDQNLNNLAYVEAVPLPKDAFPVFETELQEFKKEFKKYEKISTNLGVLERQKSTTGNISSNKKTTLTKEIAKLTTEKQTSLESLRNLNGLLLLNHKNELFLSAKYRNSLKNISMDKSTKYSTWWERPDPKNLLHYKECKKYSTRIAECVNAVTAQPVNAANQGTLKDTEKTIRTLLLNVDTILESARSLMTRFDSLSAKTRVLGKKTFYGTGYDDVRTSVVPIVAFEEDLTKLLGHILLARSGLIHVSGYSSGKTETHGSSTLLSIMSLVEDYNRQVDGLFAIMRSRKVLKEQEFTEMLKNTKEKLEEIIENCIPEKSEVKNDEKMFGSHVMNLKNQVDNMESCIQTLNNILHYYQTLESNLKNSALGRVLLLKERYGYYLETIKNLCDSLPKVF